jgi:hypothetical protein
MSYFIIGGTNVAVGQMSGGTNVGGTCVSGTKVAPPRGRGERETDRERESKT